MDRKSIAILVASVLVLIGLQTLIPKIFPPIPVPPRATNTVAGVTNTVTGSGTNEMISASGQHAPTVNPNAPEQTIVITNENAIYTFSSHGGGLKQVELLRYRATTTANEKNVTTNHYASLNSGADLPAMTLLGTGVLQVDQNFDLKRTDNGVRASKDLGNGLSVVKDFAIGSNYLVSAKTRIENHSGQPIALPAQEWVIGTATPMSTRDDGTTVGFFYYDGDSAKSQAVNWFKSGGFMGCGSSGPKDHFEEDQKIVWADVHNQFFTMATVLGDPAHKIMSRPIVLPTASEIVAAGQGGVTNGLQTSVIYGTTNVAAGAALEKQFTIYAGPKEYTTLARLAGEMKNNLDLAMGFRVPGPFGLFGLTAFFAKMLLLSMNGLHALFGGAISYAWIIILITIIIKGIFWPLTTASTRSMKRMQAYQPQLKALQEKYKDDPGKLSRKQMEFFREHKINPMGGCLPMLIQIPVFIGFYTMIRSAIELRGVSFLWAHDLTQSDTIAYIGTFPINILPIIYGVTLLYQARITPVSPTADPAQQKMMKYMPLMFLFILYKMSAGLTLYWTVQNSLTILQTKLTKATDETKTSDGKTKVEIIPPKKKK